MMSSADTFCRAYAHPVLMKIAPRSVETAQSFDEKEAVSGMRVHL